MLKVLAVSALCVAGVAAQDPATGWMAYAQGSIPSGAERITKLEVRGDDRAGGADGARSLAVRSLASLVSPSHTMPYFLLSPADELDGRRDP